MSTTLPLFWHLSSASTEERLDASVKLINGLEQFQDSKALAPTDTSEEAGDSSADDDDDEEEDGGATATKPKDNLNSEDVKYALRRLVRGLASPRESSRLGFSVALTELLTRLNTVDAAGIISTILEASVTNGSMKGQEIRDTLFARLFGLTAVIQSGLLFRNSRLTTSLSTPNELGPPASSLAAYQTTVSELLSLGDKKSWLRESSWWTITLALESLYAASPSVEWQNEAVEWTADTIYRGEHAKEWTPDKLALTLTFQNLAPNLSWKDLLAPTFRNHTILSAPNLPTIARVLKETEDVDEPDVKGVSTSGGVFKVQIHRVWNKLLESLVEGKSKVSFAEFYRVCVDESLFAATSSPERKSWGFQVFERALAVISADDYQYLFTPNFMRSWINHLSSPDRHLHKAAKKAASEIVKAVERNPSVGFTLVTHLQGAHGNQQFDRITRTKTVETILASADIEGVKKYTASLVKQLRESPAEADLSEQDTKRRYIFEQLSALMRNGSIPKDDEWVTSILELFIVHGLFTITKKNKTSPFSSLHHGMKPPLSDALRDACRAKLFTMLGDLCGQNKVVKDESGQATRLTASATDGELWITKAIKIVEALEADSTHATPLVEVDEEVAEVRERARKILKGLHKKKDVAEDEVARGAELLISALLLETYSDGEESSDVLESCLDATEQLFSLSKKSKSKPVKDEDEHPPIDLLVDAVVGMLEDSSAFGKAVAIQAFGMLSAKAEESTIDLVLLQLEHRDVNDDEEGEEEDADEANEAEQSGQDEDESIEDEEDSESEGSDEDEEEEEDDTEVDPEFRKQVAEALQVNGMDAAGDGSDSDSEDEVIFDDDQMMQLDEHLAKVFRAQAGDTKEKKGAQREATHFKIRILDLVDVFLGKQPQSPYVPRMVVPLVKIVVSAGPDERQLSEKTTGILRSRIAKLKDVPTNGFDKKAVAEDLKTLHEFARKMPLPEISACSIYLSKVLQGDSHVLDLYRASIDDFSQRKNSKLAPAFLKDFILRQTASAWGLREHIVGQTVPGVAVNVYRQIQMWQLVQTMLSQVAPLCQDPVVVDQFFKLVPLMCDSLYKTLNLACQQAEHVANAAQVKELLKIALQGARLARKIARPSDSIGSSWDVSEFEKVRDALLNSERFKASSAIQSSAKQLLALLSQPPATQKEQGSKKRKGGKPEASEETVVNGVEEASEPRKKRKKVKKQKSE